MQIAAGNIVYLACISLAPALSSKIIHKRDLTNNNNSFNVFVSIWSDICNWRNCAIVAAAANTTAAASATATVASANQYITMAEPKREVWQTDLTDGHNNGMAGGGGGWER